MIPFPAPQHLQHMVFSIVSFVALLTNILVAFAPLPQAITVHQVRRPQSSKLDQPALVHILTPSSARVPEI